MVQRAEQPKSMSDIYRHRVSYVQLRMCSHSRHGQQNMTIRTGRGPVFRAKINEFPSVRQGEPWTDQREPPSSRRLTTGTHIKSSDSGTIVMVPPKWRSVNEPSLTPPHPRNGDRSPETRGRDWNWAQV